MDAELESALIEHFWQFIPPGKKEKMAVVLEERTDHLRVVLDNIYQSHNASAVVRTCDCFGVQNIHVIESDYNYRPNSEVALGASKWINSIRYKQEAHSARKACIDDLRKNGFQIVATALTEKSISLPELDVSQPIALVFGTEKDGLDQDWLEEADHTVLIPMCGFTQSLNVSVSAALCIYHITQKIKTTGIAWELSDKMKRSVQLLWARNTLKNSQIIEDQFVKRYTHKT